MTGEPELHVVVECRRRLAEGVLELVLRSDAGPLPAWEPGAHLDLVLGDGLVRQFSLCGDPADRTRYVVAVLREPAGRGGSAFVHEHLDVGDRLTVRGPRNHFRLVDAAQYLFIAGGIGITPLLPMIRRLAASGARWRLVYGGRSRTSMAYLDELTGLPDVSVCPQDECGLLDLESILGPAPDGCVVYCCGPESLLAAVEQRCAASWPAGALHVERFSPRPIEAAEPVTAFDVECAESGVVVHVPADTSILAAVEAAGISVLSSCQEGTCGTCETVILAGEADHRDSVLSPEEQRAGEVMMICCSRARSPRLVLQL